MDDNFTHISNHNTKLNAYVRLNDELRLDSCFRIYWHYQGMEDLNEYAKTQPTDLPGWHGLPADPSFHTYFGPLMRLDLSLTWEMSPSQTLRLSGYNLLGLIDKDFNREMMVGSGEYYRQPVSYALTYEFKF